MYSGVGARKDAFSLHSTFEKGGDKSYSLFFVIRLCRLQGRVIDSCVERKLRGFSVFKGHSVVCWVRTVAPLP